MRPRADAHLRRTVDTKPRRLTTHPRIDRRERRVHARDPFRQRPHFAEGIEVAGVVPRADAQDEAAAGDPIERCRRLRDELWPPAHDHDH